MRKLLKKTLCAFIVLVFMLVPALAGAASKDTVVLGNDLSDSQREKVLSLMGIEYLDDVDEVLYVTIDEERALLGGLIPEKIGSRSLSSARVTLTGKGSGINVKTHNINYMTEAMYASALITAGINDADVVIAAPTGVSGTAALAGIFKAYEVATSATLDSIAKAVASEELLLSGELAEFVGSDEAVQLIAELKQVVLDNGWDNEATIRPAVEDALRRMNMTLDEKYVDQIIQMLLKFCSLDMDPKEIAKQLQGYVKAMQTAYTAQSKISEFMGKVSDVFVAIGNWFKNIFR